MNENPYVTGREHRWVLSGPRLFELKSGRSVFQTGCVRCGRDFVIDRSSGARHAVHVSIFSFHRLSDEVAQRWALEPCPGERLPSDDSDRKNRIAELQISWQQSLE
jgi:hypothetical protein